MTKFRVKPTMKERWRYIVFEVMSESKVPKNEVVRAFTTALLRLFGEVGASNTNIWLVDFNETKKSGIVRCSHKAVNTLVSSISTVTKINDMKAGILVKGISGTIKKTGRFLHNNP